MTILTDFNISAAQLETTASAYSWELAHTELVSGDEIKRTFTRGDETIVVYEAADNGKIVSFSWVQGQSWTAVGEDQAGVYALLQLSQLKG